MCSILCVLKVHDLCVAFSIIGAIIVIVGLYLLLWGKEGDEEVETKSKAQSSKTYEEHNKKKKTKIVSAEKDVTVLNGEP